MVEGHGDVEAVPIVVQRIAQHVMPHLVVQVTAPLRTPKSRLVKPGELERAIELAGRRVARTGGVLVVLDSDDDCPAEVGPELLARASQIGLPPDLQTPPDPEAIRGAKEWLTQRMQGARSYSPTLDEPVLARLFDLDSALQTDSFAKFRREVERLLRDAADAW